MSYTNFPCNDVQKAKSQIYRNAKSELQCGRNDTCEIKIDVEGNYFRKIKTQSIYCIMQTFFFQSAI